MRKCGRKWCLLAKVQAPGLPRPLQGDVGSVPRGLLQYQVPDKQPSQQMRNLSAAC